MVLRICPSAVRDSQPHMSANISQWTKNKAQPAHEGSRKTEHAAGRLQGHAMSMGAVGRVFLAILLASGTDGFHLGRTSTRSSMRLRSVLPENHRDANWNLSTAVQETQDDISDVLKAYDARRQSLVESIDLFTTTRLRDGDGANHPSLPSLQDVTLWGIGLAQLLELPGGRHDDAIFERLLDVASHLLRAQTDMLPYVEQTLMRGWPMIVTKRTQTPMFEAFMFGHIGLALSHAARAAALRGKHLLAASLLEPVLWYLHDGFFNLNMATTKLNKQGQVAFVPEGAPAARKRRHANAVGGVSADECLSEPQPYSDAIMVVRAALQAARAIDTIDWDSTSGTVHFYDWEAKDWREKLSSFVLKNAAWARQGFWEPPPTGADKRDNYPGVSGSRWWLWKSRDLSNCPEQKGSPKDRVEDISRAPIMIDFIAEFREWVHEQHHKRREQLPAEAAGIFSEGSVKRLLVTFLNRVVRDPKGKTGRKFACDVQGIHDDDRWGNPKRQCGSQSRHPVARPRHAVGFLPLAFSVREGMKQDSPISCDAFRTVNHLLPMAIPGRLFNAANFADFGSADTADMLVISKLIQAKFYFYNFKQRLDDSCGPLKPREVLL